MRYWLAIPAAGAGRRFGAAGLPKQYQRIAGRSMLEWACSAFAGDQRCAGAVFALAQGDEHWPAARQALAAAGLRNILEAPGGAQRADSVRSALRVLATQAAPRDLVLVHDAARPCLERVDLDALLAAAAQSDDGALLAAPLADTLKRGEPAAAGASAGASAAVSAGARVAETLPREQLWRALTPQAAPLATLSAALEHAAGQGRIPTDEAQALEWMGAKPRLVAGAASNLKVTTPDDLRIAQALLESRAHAKLPPGAGRA